MANQEEDSDEAAKEDADKACKEELEVLVVKVVFSIILWSFYAVGSYRSIDRGGTGHGRYAANAALPPSPLRCNVAVPESTLARSLAGDSDISSQQSESTGPAHDAQLGPTAATTSSGCAALPPLPGPSLISGGGSSRSSGPLDTPAASGASSALSFGAGSAPLAPGPKISLGSLGPVTAVPEAITTAASSASCAASSTSGDISASAAAVASESGMMGGAEGDCAGRQRSLAISAADYQADTSDSGPAVITAARALDVGVLVTADCPAVDTSSSSPAVITAARALDVGMLVTLSDSYSRDHRPVLAGPLQPGRAGTVIAIHDMWSGRHCMVGNCMVGNCMVGNWEMGTECFV